MSLKIKKLEDERLLHSVNSSTKEHIFVESSHLRFL